MTDLIGCDFLLLKMKALDILAVSVTGVDSLAVEIQRLENQLEGGTDFAVLIVFLLLAALAGFMVYMYNRQKKLWNLLHVQQQQLAKADKQKQKVDQLKDESSRTKRTLQKLEREIRDVHKSSGDVAADASPYTGEKEVLDKLEAEIHKLNLLYSELDRKISDQEPESGGQYHEAGTHPEISDEPDDRSSDDVSTESTTEAETSHTSEMVEDKSESDESKDSEEVVAEDQSSVATDYSPDSEEVAESTLHEVLSESEIADQGESAESLGNPEPQHEYEQPSLHDQFVEQDHNVNSLAVGDEGADEELSNENRTLKADESDNPEEIQAEPQPEESGAEDNTTQPDESEAGTEGRIEDDQYASDPSATTSDQPESEIQEDQVDQTETSADQPGGFGLKGVSPASEKQKETSLEQPEENPEEPVEQTEESTTEPENKTEDKVREEPDSIDFFTSIQSPDYYEKSEMESADEATHIQHALALIEQAREQGSPQGVMKANQILNPIKDGDSSYHAVAAQVHAEGLAALAEINRQPLLFTRAVSQFKKVSTIEGVVEERLYARWGLCLIKTGLISEKDNYIEQAGKILEKTNPDDTETALTFLVADFLINQTPPADNPDVDHLIENWDQNMISKKLNQWKSFDKLQELIGGIEVKFEGTTEDSG